MAVGAGAQFEGASVMQSVNQPAYTKTAHERPEQLLNFGNTRRLPVTLQTEAAECGLACLSMIASYHGYEADLASLRRRFSIFNSIVQQGAANQIDIREVGFVTEYVDQ